MDYLMNKMKVLLDEDGKPKKDDKSNTGNHTLYQDTRHSLTQLDMPAASYGERSLTDQPGGQGGYPPQPQSYPPQPQSYPPQPQSYPLQQQPYPPAAPGQYQYQQQQQPYSTQGPGYYQQPQQQPYGQGAPVPQGPPAPYGPPPPMPSGWFQQWDQANQRAYYVEQATGRTQWDPPHSPPPSSAPYQAQAGHDERGLFGNTQGHGGHDYAQAPAGYPAAAPVAYAPVQEKKKDKDSGHSTAMLAAAGIGGLAAGAWIGHELSTSISNIILLLSMLC